MSECRDLDFLVDNTINNHIEYEEVLLSMNFNTSLNCYELIVEDQTFHYPKNFFSDIAGLSFKKIYHLNFIDDVLDEYLKETYNLRVLIQVKSY